VGIDGELFEVRNRTLNEVEEDVGLLLELLGLFACLPRGSECLIDLIARLVWLVAATS